MITINPELPQQDILNFVKDWMILLAYGHFNEACALLDEPNCYGTVWTPDKIKETVQNTFNPETQFYAVHPEGPIFSDPYELEEQKRVEVIEFNDGSGYAFDYDLSLNGEWSDLTAQFEFYKRPNGYAVVLHDIHVL